MIPSSFPLFLLVSFLSASSLVAADLTISHLLPRPLIVEYHRTSVEDLNPNLPCESWRIAGEANNLNPWATIPNECHDYVRSYVTGRAYVSDLEIVSTEAAAFAEGFKLQNDGNDVWVFDIDETLLSNLPYYAQHGYGGELLELGFRIILLTGRSEAQRDVTERNLRVAGFQRWDRLILRGIEDHGKLATTYKSEKRTWMLEQGYRIVGNSGDQWSDLLCCPISNRSFKIPNPIPSPPFPNCYYFSSKILPYKVGDFALNLAEDRCFHGGGIFCFIHTHVWNELEKENKGFFEAYAESKSKDQRMSEEETSAMIKKMITEPSKQDSAD
ncbi:Acid phosphatase 1 [Linum perenne]